MESSPPILFDRALLRKRQARAAASIAEHDFLWREAADRAAESISFILRDFPRVLGFGTQHLPPLRGQVEHVMGDDEEHLPYAENSFDAVISLLTLQWVNDVPGALAQIRRVLKPDGLFFAILPGGESLRELRDVLAQTEAALYGGISPRVSPFVDVRDGGALLQRAGFALPVADSETISISYANLFALMDDLRKSGQNNALSDRTRRPTTRAFFVQAAAAYAAQHADAEGRIPATVELVTLTGWKPAENQQKPAPRGSGKISLSQALK